MAKIFGLDTTGKIIRFLQSQDEEERVGIPDVFDSLLEFDEETNAEVIRELNTNWNAHELVGGVLYRDGVEVVINPPDSHSQSSDFKSVRDNWPLFNQRVEQAEEIGQNWDNMTQGQKNTFILNNFGEILLFLAFIGRIIRLIKRFLNIKRWMGQ